MTDPRAWQGVARDAPDGSSAPAAEDATGWPEALIERVRALAAGTEQAVQPRDAATVILLRDGVAGLEVFLLQRATSMAFAAGATVFPGGSVDLRDAHLPDRYWSGPPPSSWTEVLGADVDLARALVCAAVRETFEESGVLLAGSTGDDVVADTLGADWELDRQALVDRSMALTELLERRALVLRTDLLRPWAHWITPEIETKRFDTRFFVAALPTGQRTRDVGGEATRIFWLHPRDALDRAHNGAIALLPPTFAALTDLAEHDDVAAVLDAADRREIRPLLPKVLVDEPDTAQGTPAIRFLLPGDADYPA